MCTQPWASHGSGWGHREKSCRRTAVFFFPQPLQVAAKFCLRFVWFILVFFSRRIYREKNALWGLKRTQVNSIFRLYLNTPLQHCTVQQRVHRNLVIQLCSLLCCPNQSISYSSAIFKFCCIKDVQKKLPLQAIWSTKDMLQSLLDTDCSAHFVSIHFLQLCRLSNSVLPLS